MRIPLFFLLPLFLPFALLAQDEEGSSPFGKGLVSNQGAISPGITLGEGNGIHLHGTLAYRFHDRFSYRADSYFMLPGENAPELDQFTTLFSGFSYHFTENKALDPYLSFQPGLAYSQLGAMEGSANGAMGESFDPMLSGAVGIKYHAPAVFNILVETRYLHGKRLTSQGSLPLSGFRFTFGLGFHLNVLNPFWKG